MPALEIKKKVANAILYTNGLVKIENVRFSYPHADKPFAGKSNNSEDGSEKKEQKAKYGIIGMLPKKTHAAAHGLINEAIDALLKANKSGDGTVPTVGSQKKFMTNGDDHEQSETYGGHWLVSCREERKPSVRDKRGNLVTDPAEIRKIIVGGYWGHILIRPWYQDGQRVGKGYGRRVNAGFVGVQHIKDDETFGEGVIDDSDAWTDESDNSASSGFDDEDDGEL